MRSNFAMKPNGEVVVICDDLVKRYSAAGSLIEAKQVYSGGHEHNTLSNIPPTYPEGIAIDKNGNVYGHETYNPKWYYEDRLFLIQDGTEEPGWILARDDPRYPVIPCDPYGIDACHAFSGVFLLDRYDDKVCRISPSGSEMWLKTADELGLSDIGLDPRVGPNGVLVSVSAGMYYGYNIACLDPGTGALKWTTNESFNDVLCWGMNGNAYALKDTWDSDVVLEYAPDGTFIREIDLSDSYPDINIQDFKVDRIGNIYVEHSREKIIMFDSSGVLGWETPVDYTVNFSNGANLYLK